MHLFRGAAFQAAVDRIVRRVLSNGNTVSLVEGHAGTGKTSIAHRVAWELARTERCLVGDVSVPMGQQVGSEHMAAEIMEAVRRAASDVPDESGLRPAIEKITRPFIGERIVRDPAAELSGSLSAGIVAVGGSKGSSGHFVPAQRYPTAKWLEALDELRATAASYDIDKIVIHLDEIDEAVTSDPEGVSFVFGASRRILLSDGFHFVLCGGEAFRKDAIYDRETLLSQIGLPIAVPEATEGEFKDMIAERYSDVRAHGPGFASTARGPDPIEPAEAVAIFRRLDSRLRDTFDVMGRAVIDRGSNRGLTADDVFESQAQTIHAKRAALPTSHRETLEFVYERGLRCEETTEEDFKGRFARDESYESIAARLVSLGWLIRARLNHMRHSFSPSGKERIARGTRGGIQ